MNLEKASYPAYRRSLILGSALLLAILVLGLSWKLHASYVADRRTAEVQTKNLAQAMDAHVSSVLQFVDLALVGSADALKSLDPDQLRTPETVRQLLAASGREPDTNFWLFFLGADGVGVVASNGLAIGGVSYADRPYFDVHANGTVAGLFVGAPEIGKVSRRRIFFLSRAVRSPTGRFLGVVAAPIDAGVLAAVFRGAAFQPGLSVALVHADGKVIARAPRFEESFASNVAGTALFDQLKVAQSGTYEATSIVDGDNRMYSYRRLKGLPLVVVVGMASEAWTSGLIDDLLVAAVGLTTIVAILLIGGRFALKSYQRLEASEAGHRLLNADLQAARERLAHSEERMRLVTDHLPALISYIDADQRYVFRNAAYEQVDGIDADTMVGKTVREVHGDADYRLVADEIARALRGESVVFEREVQLDGATRHWKFEYTPDVVDGNQVAGLYAVATETTDTKRVEHRLRSQANIDALTGLPNRHQLYERFEQALARCRRASTKLACLYLDIDHFKQVNDTLGHASGDELLKQFGARLQASVRETDLVARISGDEFVIVSEGVEHASDAAVVARKIIEAMKIPFTLDGNERVVTASIGGVVASGHDEDLDALLKKADRSLYQAKRMGGNLFHMYDTAVEDG